LQNEPVRLQKPGRWNAAGIGKAFIKSPSFGSRDSENPEIGRGASISRHVLSIKRRIVPEAALLHFFDAPGPGQFHR